MEDVVTALESIQEPVSLYEPVFHDDGDAIYVMDQVRDSKNTDENWLRDIAVAEAMKHLQHNVDNVKEITENGIKILKYMQQHETHKGSLFKASDIGEGLFMSGRSVAGCMRKLITDGFVEKLGQDPVIYAITEKGKNYIIEE